MFFIEVLAERSGQGIEKALRRALVERRRVVNLGEEGIERTQERLGGEHADNGRWPPGRA